MLSSFWYQPGNYSTALNGESSSSKRLTMRFEHVFDAAGAGYGYALLFVVLLSGLFAILLQILATRLGIITGKDLAQHCRRALHDRPNHKMLYRWGMLYPLYFIAESMAKPRFLI